MPFFLLMPSNKLHTVNIFLIFLAGLVYYVHQALHKNCHDHNLQSREKLFASALILSISMKMARMVAT